MEDIKREIQAKIKIKINREGAIYPARFASLLPFLGDVHFLSRVIFLVEVKFSGGVTFLGEDTSLGRVTPFGGHFQAESLI